MGLDLYERVETSTDFVRLAGLADPRLSGLPGLVAEIFPKALSGEGLPSGLNHDATPVQLCLSLRQHGSGWRVIYDPGIAAKDPCARHTHALEVLGRFGPEFGALVQPLLEEIGPGSALAAEAFTYGVFWLAQEIGGEGRAIYLDISAHQAHDDLTARATKAFGNIAMSVDEIDRLMQGFAPFAISVSAGVEERGGSCRLKLHLRLTKRPGEGELARLLPMLADPQILKACSEVLRGNDRTAAMDTVIEMAFTRDGALNDGKIDFAMPSICCKEESFVRAALAARALDVVWPRETVRAFAAFSRIAYLGIGRDLEGQPRLNLYLKPDTPL